MSESVFQVGGTTERWLDPEVTDLISRFPMDQFLAEMAIRM